MNKEFKAVLYFGNNELSKSWDNNLTDLTLTVLTVLEDSSAGTHAIILNSRDGRVLQRCRKTMLI